MKSLTKREEFYDEELGYLNRQLAVKRKYYQDQPTIFTKEAIELITLEFEYLKKNSKLNFEYKLIKNEVMTENDDTMTIFSVRRIVKLRFKCVNQKCKNFHCQSQVKNENGQEIKLQDTQTSKASTKKVYVGKQETLNGEASKKQDDKKQEKGKQQSKKINCWTSYYGLVDFRFFLQNIPRKKSSLLGYSFYIYRQKCKVCEEWGKCGLIKSNFNKLLDLYYLMVKQILFKIKERKQVQIAWRDCEKYGSRPEMKGVFNSHMQQLCQACDEGLCLRFYNESEFNYDSSNDVQEEESEYLEEYIVNTNSQLGRYR